MKRHQQTLLKWFMASPFMQAISRFLLRPWNPHQWIFVRKEDPRFEIHSSTKKVFYPGDDNVLATTLATNRNAWETWLVVRLSTESPAALLACDTYDGQRLVCYGQIICPRQMVAMRVGHEDATAFFVRHVGSDAKPGIPQIEFVARVRARKLKRKYPDALRV